ncbi:MAG: uroporphyrinogen decarboxylase family protein [Lentisphaeria bacterium]|nr:uroporphyrinogen decarboxylase family protein [Lentisphaeria bacterium]
MTSKERIRAALHGQPVDHTPFSPFLAYVWEYFPLDVQAAGRLAFHHRVGADPLWRGAPCPVKAIMPEGIERKTVDEGDRVVTHVSTPVGNLRFAYAKSDAGNTDFLVEHPLKTEEDYKVRMWMEEGVRYKSNAEAVAEHFATNGQEGLSLGQLIPRCKSAYQDLVEFFAGTEELIYAQMDFPDTVRALWEVMVANDLKAVKMSLESDYEHFITWEDSSTQNYSPGQYDAFIGSEIGEWCRLLAGAGKYYVQHACGHVAALTERMRDHGVFAIESISPPPTGNLSIKDARAMIGDSMGIIGGIEPTQFLNLHGDDLRRYTESVIDDARGGPFVLANSDSCPPGVTVEKFKLVADVAKATRS